MRMRDIIARIIGILKYSKSTQKKQIVASKNRKRTLQIFLIRQSIYLAFRSFFYSLSIEGVFTFCLAFKIEIPVTFFKRLRATSFS